MFGENIDLARIIQQVAIVVPGFLLAITVHEFTHGYVALKCGDHTARFAGRLTFNPISHLDPLGTVVLILSAMTGFAIGWAKPVPVDARNLHNPRRDMVWVSLGGPAANLGAAIILAMVLHVVASVFYGRPVLELLYLDRARILSLDPVSLMLQAAIMINVVFLIFNLIPVPPLDGSKILEGLLPPRHAYQFSRIEPYGFMILLFLLATGVVNYILIPPYRIIMRLLLGGLG